MLNAQVARVLAELGHTHTVVVEDWGCRVRTLWRWSTWRSRPASPYAKVILLWGVPL